MNKTFITTAMVTLLGFNGSALAADASKENKAKNKSSKHVVHQKFAHNKHRLYKKDTYAKEKQNKKNVANSVAYERKVVQTTCVTPAKCTGVKTTQQPIKRVDSLKVTINGVVDARAAWGYNKSQYDLAPIETIYNRNKDHVPIGTLYDYSRKDYQSVDADIRIRVQQDNDNFSYGADVELLGNASVNNVHNGFRGIGAKGAYIFFSNSNLGSIEIGSNKGAETTMRIDASSISTASGGIDSNWYRYANVEGYYSKGGTDPATNKFFAGTVVRHPFYLVPRLPTEYMYTDNIYDFGLYPTSGFYPRYGIIKRATDNYFASRPVLLPIKLTYYSPRFSGLRFGVSYTPNQYDQLNNIAGTYNRLSNIVVGAAPIRDNNSGYKNIVSGGIDFEYNYQDILVKASVTGEFGNFEGRLYDHIGKPVELDDLKALNVGAKIKHPIGLSFAASFANTFHSWKYKNPFVAGDYSGGDITLPYSSTISAPTKDSVYWTAGLAYEKGPYMVSGTYFHSSNYQSLDRENKLDNFALGAHYNFSTNSKTKFTPYIQWNHFITEEYNVTKDTNNSGDVLLAGVKYSF